MTRQFQRTQPASLPQVPHLCLFSDGVTGAYLDLTWVLGTQIPLPYLVPSPLSTVLSPSPILDKASDNKDRPTAMVQTGLS